MPSLNLFLTLIALLSSRSAFASGEETAAPTSQEKCDGERDPETTAEQFCKRFSATPLLQQDDAVKSSLENCKKFWSAAVEGVNAVCDYKKTAAAFKKRYDDAIAALPPGQSLDTGTAQKMFSEAGDTSKDSFRRLDAVLTKLTNAYESSKSDLQKIQKLGVERTQREMGCFQQGDPGKAPGIFLEGLYYNEAKDQKATYKNVGQALFDAKNMALASTNGNRNLMGRADRIHLGQVTPGTASSTPDSETKSVVAAAAERAIVDKSAEKIAERIATGAKGTVVGTGISLAYELIVHHEVDPHGLVITGVAILAGATVGPEASVPVAVVLTVADTAIQNKIAEAKNKYLGWARDQLNANINMASSDLAKNWKQVAEVKQACDAASQFGAPGMPGSPGHTD